MTEQDAKNLTQSFKEFKKNKQKIKLLGIIEETPLPKNFSTLDDLVKLKTSAISVLEKYAIISHKEWVDNFITIGNFFTPGLPIKSFKTEDREEAINWLQKENIKEHNPKDYLSNIEIKKLEKDERTISTEFYNLRGQLEKLKAGIQNEVITNERELLNQILQTKVSLMTRLENFENFLRDANTKRTASLDLIKTLEDTNEGIDKELAAKKGEADKAKNDISDKDGSYREIAEQLSVASNAFNEKKNSKKSETPKQPRKYLADLALIAKLQLNQLGIKNINQLSHCTFTRETEYFSYRRDGQTGRMATIICRT